MIKRFSLVLIIISVLLFISCGGSSAEMIKGATKPELIFRITWKSYTVRGEAIQRIVDAYNSQPGNKHSIVMENGDEDFETVKALLDAESNFVYVLPYRYVQYFGGQGKLIDLSAEFADAQGLFYPQIWALGTVNGKVFGIPWLGHSMCLLYNKTLLDQAGVDAASINSMESFVDAIEKVEEKTSAKGIGLVGANSNDISWMVNQFIYGFGSGLVNKDGTKVTINNDKSETALSFYKDVLGPHAQETWVNDTGADVMDAFREQKIAFEIQGIWGVTDILKNGSPFDVGIITLNDIGLCSEVSPKMMALPVSMSEQSKQEAIRFIQYMISKDAQENILLGEYSPEHDTYYPFRIPIRTDLTDSPILQENPDYLKFIEGFENPSIDVPVPQWQTVKKEIYEPGLHKVMSDLMSIQEFLATIEREGTRLLNEH